MYVDTGLHSGDLFYDRYLVVWSNLGDVARAFDAISPSSGACDVALTGHMTGLIPTSYTDLCKHYKENLARS